jgi:thiol-disulfide isomerase/thioredoxin
MTIKTCCFSFMLIGFVALGILMSSGCGSSKKQPEDIFVIHGKLKNTNGEKIVLVQMKTDSLKPIDSMMIDDKGEFRFSYKPAGICFYMLKLADDNFITLLLNKGENVEITGNSRQLASEYKVVGSAGSELLSQLNDHTRMNFKKSDSLLGVLEPNKDSVDFIEIKAECDSMYAIIFSDQQEYVKSFIQKNPTSLTSLFALYQTFGRKKVLNERDHFRYFKMLDSVLIKLYPDIDFAIDLHSRVVEIEKFRSELKAAEAKIDSGMMAPDISMKNIGGVVQTLSSLKGKTTLLLFWAGSSQPSLRVLDSYKWIQKKYAPKGFSIYAVSLDKYRQTWEGAVREHKLNWIHVSDLLEWESPVVKLYAIESIPYAILIDNEGKIVKRGITDQQLSAWLYKNFKF